MHLALFTKSVKTAIIYIVIDILYQLNIIYQKGERNMKTVIISAHECKGTYEGKPYENGRLVLAHFDQGAVKYPAYISVAKTTTAVVEQLQGKTPLEGILTYDAFKRVTAVDFS